jgi:myo-inositol-1(or 4)-monophosphatase
VKILSKYSKFASAGEKADVRQNTPELVDPANRPTAELQQDAAAGASPDE